MEELEKRVQQLDARVKELEAENRSLLGQPLGRTSPASSPSLSSQDKAGRFTPDSCAQTNWIKKEKD